MGRRGAVPGDRTTGERDLDVRVLLRSAAAAVVLLVEAGVAGPALAGGEMFFSDEAEAPWARAYLAAANLRGLKER